MEVTFVNEISTLSMIDSNYEQEDIVYHIYIIFCSSFVYLSQIVILRLKGFTSDYHF